MAVSPVMEYPDNRDTELEMRESSADTDDREVVSQQKYRERIAKIFRACFDWAEGCVAATEFAACELGAFDRVVCEHNGSFADAEQVKLLERDYELTAALAICVEDAALMIGESGAGEDCGTLVRAFYLALALRSSAVDLDALQPGWPVHCIDCA